MSVNIGISATHLQNVATALQVLLADEFVLYTKTRNYHWNLEGSNFMEMHKFYESQYELLEDVIDEVAERIRTLGHYTEARLKDFIKISHLVEDDYTNDQRKQLQNLLDDIETIIREARKMVDDFSEKYKDQGTADFVTGIMKMHEKTAWFIRSYLK